MDFPTFAALSSTLRIGINTRLLLPGELDGIGKFTSEVAYRLADLAPEHEFHWFFDRRVELPAELPPNVIIHVLPPPTRHPFLYYIWFEGMLPRALKRNGIERFFSPDGFLSLRSKVPAFPVIHDLNFELYPQDLPFWTRTYYRRFFPRFARKASRIMTVSEHSARDIRQRYGVEEQLIRVVYNGVDERFHPIPAADQKKVRDRWTEGSPFLIHVGSLHPRKNIARTIRSFNSYQQKRGQDLKLVFVGKSMWWTRDMEEALKELEEPERVVFTGHLGDASLNQLLASSMGLLYLSYFEGFGIPVLEAMKAEVPVLCSDRTSLPEVGGNAVLYTDPGCEVSIEEGMARLMEDEELRQRVIEKGKERAEAFTWDRVAQRVKRTLEEELS